MVIIGIVFSGALSRTNSQMVSRSSIGKAWPFAPHQTARIECELRKFGSIRHPIVTIEIAGRTYGLNGAAKGVGGHPDVYDLLERDPESGAYKLGATPELLQLGLDLCQR